MHVDVHVRIHATLGSISTMLVCNGCAAYSSASPAVCEKKMIRTAQFTENDVLFHLLTIQMYYTVHEVQVV